MQENKSVIIIKMGGAVAIPSSDVLRNNRDYSGSIESPLQLSWDAELPWPPDLVQMLSFLFHHSGDMW